MGKETPTAPKLTKKQTRAKALLQCYIPDFVARALREGIPKRLIELRREVCGLKPHEVAWVIGAFAGEEGDNNARSGCPISKCTQKLLRARRLGRKKKGGGKGCKKETSLKGLTNIPALNVLVPPSDSTRMVNAVDHPPAVIPRRRRIDQLSLGLEVDAIDQLSLGLEVDNILNNTHPRTGEPFTAYGDFASLPLNPDGTLVCLTFTDNDWIAAAGPIP